MKVDPCQKAREAVEEATRKLIAAAKSTSDADQQTNLDAHEIYQKALADLDECESEATKFVHENTKPHPHRPVK